LPSIDNARLPLSGRASHPRGRAVERTTPNFLEMPLPPDLVTDWDFTPNLGWALRARRLGARLRRRPPPAHRVLVPAAPRRAWAVYFVFLPQGGLTAAHRYTLERLRALDAGVLVVCATPTPERVPAELRRWADALCWKALSGFDFSGYAIGLRLVADRSPGATVLVMNDSVFGPFGDLTPQLAAPRWDLSGFTASSTSENHVQSYAFFVRDVTPVRVRQLSTVLSTGYAYDRMEDVVLHQELAFAREASRHMTVGSAFYGDVRLRPDQQYDPTLLRPFELLDAGLPFLKRSLLGKHQGFQHADRVAAELARRGHPVPA
jgi:lipopolysaccharide biosynthesis protein